MKNFLRLLLALIISIASGSLLAQQEPAPKPIRVGVIGPFTGGSAPMGISMRNAVRMATEEINWKGGLLGRPVELIERDDQANNQHGEQMAMDLIQNEHVDFAVGLINTGVALAVLKHFQNARIPFMVNVSAGAILTQQFQNEKESFIFRCSANDFVQSEIVVKEAVDRNGYRRVALLTDVTAYGKQGNEQMKKRLEERHLTPVMEGTFEIKQTDMSSIVNKARAAGAQALLVWGIGPELAAIARTRSQLGWNVPIIGAWTLSLENFIQPAAASGNGARMPQTFIAEPITSRRQEFLISYRNATKAARTDEIPSAVSAAQGYDSMLLMSAAIKQAGSLNASAVREALENLQQPVWGVVSTYRKPYSQKNHEAISADMVVTGEVWNGKIRHAYNEEIRSIILGRRIKK